MGRIAKEVGLVGGHGFDHAMADLGLMRGLDEYAQVVDGLQAELPDDGSEAAFEEVVLIPFKHDAGMRIDVFLEKLVVVRIDYRD